MSYSPRMLIGRFVAAHSPLQCCLFQFIPVMRPCAGSENPVYEEFINLFIFFFISYQKHFFQHFTICFPLKSRGPKFWNSWGLFAMIFLIVWALADLWLGLCLGVQVWVCSKYIWKAHALTSPIFLSSSENFFFLEGYKNAQKAHLFRSLAQW